MAEQKRYTNKTDEYGNFQWASNGDGVALAWNPDSFNTVVIRAKREIAVPKEAKTSLRTFLDWLNDKAKGVSGAYTYDLETKLTQAQKLANMFANLPEEEKAAILKALSQAA